MARTKKVSEVAPELVTQDAATQDAVTPAEAAPAKVAPAKVAPAAVELVKMISGSGVTYDIHPSMVESAKADGLIVIDNAQE